MILLIDIGNSRTKYVELINDAFSPITSLNNNMFTVSYFDNHFTRVSKVIVANVAEARFTSVLAAWCQKKHISFSQVKSEKQKNTLISAYQDPSSLGVDRWLALLAAEHLFPAKKVLIIDAGTATTVDLLERNGQHQGGWILAGVNALVTGILSHSTLVQAQKTAPPSITFGLNTSDNVHHASWAATLGMIHQAIKQAQTGDELEHIILTGGNSQALTQWLVADTEGIKELTYSIECIDKLIFFGLKQYV